MSSHINDVQSWVQRSSKYFFEETTTFIQACVFFVFLDELIGLFSQRCEAGALFSIGEGVIKTCMLDTTRNQPTETPFVVRAAQNSLGNHQSSSLGDCGNFLDANTLPLHDKDISHSNHHLHPLQLMRLCSERSKQPVALRKATVSVRPW